MATITLKNIPDEVYARLKAAAKAHHRSMNGEVLNCLELTYAPQPVAVAERLSRLRAIRPELDSQAVSLEELQQAITDGRP